MAREPEEPKETKKPKGFMGLFKAKLPAEKEPEKPAKKIDDDFLSDALDRVQAAYQFERNNMEAGYEDLAFLKGDQWPTWAKQQRENQKRPILTINLIPQFVRQVTGDMRMMKPAIKVIPIDARGKKPIAELISGMIRYIENRSEAQSAYAIAADSQVAAGMGHWRVTTEYAEETTFNQEIRIVQINDGLSVMWDTDSILPTKEDAMWCIVPIDMSMEKFKKTYPDVPVEDFVSYDRRFHEYWFSTDRVRVGEYWEKRPAKRKLACLPDGSIDDLTDATPEDIAKVKAQGAKIEERDGYKIFRSLITIGNVLEQPEEWAGRMIPIVPVIGEEIRIGREIDRRGIVRGAKDAQRAYNYNISTMTEFNALAPKAPWIGTEKNFEEFESEWSQSNEVNWPYLRFTPDPKNGNQAPQRVQGISTNPGLSEGVALAQQNLKQITGLYDASLGARSNETSGVAIKARQQEGDVGTVAYAHNFSRAVRHTGRILVDLIPHVYDTERMIQVLGEDGTVHTIQINKAMASPDLDPEATAALGEEGENDTAPVDNSGLDIDDTYDDEPVSAKSKPKGVTLNDVTVGAYDVIVHTGPDYSTKRDEAREGMAQFIQAAPETAPLILDLFAKAQDWPLAQEIGERLMVMLPPPIQQLLAHKKQGVGEIQQPVEPGPQMPPQGPPPPPPGEVAAQQADVIKAQSTAQVAQSNVQIAQAHVRVAELNLEAKRIDVQGKAHGQVMDVHSSVLDFHHQNIQHDRTMQAMEPAPAAPAQTAPAAQPQQGGYDSNAALMQSMAQELAHQRGMIEELVKQIHTPMSGAIDGPPGTSLPQ